mgnify:CR=1 FL=1
MNFKKGDKIEWTYEHSLNRKSKTHITKTGIFIRVLDMRKLSRARRIPQYNSEISSYAIVHFDGNKNPSKVLINELRAANSN